MTHTLSPAARAAALLAASLAPPLLAPPAAAQEGAPRIEGSMEVRLAGQDRTFLIVPGEGAHEVGELGRREVTLVGAPEDVEGEAPRIAVAFLVEGLGTDAAASDARIAYTDEGGATMAGAEGLTADVSLTSFTEIGSSFVLTGDFSAELAADEATADEDGIVGVSGTFQATIDTGADTPEGATDG